MADPVAAPAAGGAGVAPPASRPRRFTPTQRARLTQGAGWAFGALVIVVLALATDWARVREEFADLDLAREQFPRVVTIAARNTILYTAFSYAGGLVLGLLAALGRLSSVPLLRAYARVYIELFRGLPAILTIFLVGYALPIGLGIKIPKVWFLEGAGILALSLVAGAYMAETIRAGIQAVPKGQTEAARSLGMTSLQSLRFIVIPQAFRIVIPPLANELILLLKDTALLSILGMTVDSKELMKFGRDGTLDTLNMTPLIVIGVIYLLISVPLSQGVARLERRNQRGR